MLSPSYRMLRYFEHAHLPPELAAVSKPFGDLAQHLCETLPPNAELTVALRKLLESKDCAVRAALYPVEQDSQLWDPTRSSEPKT